MSAKAADTAGGNGNKAVAGTKAIDRALDVLSSFVDSPEQGITDIATRSSLSPSTVHRIVRALVQSGYLEQSPETDRYHLGHAAHVLGQTARESWGCDRALPILERIGGLTGESVNMGVADGTELRFAAGSADSTTDDMVTSVTTSDANAVGGAVYTVSVTRGGVFEKLVVRFADGGTGCVRAVATPCEEH